MQDWTPEQLKEHLDAGETVFLKLWKQGCGACKMSEPATRRLEDSYGDTVTFAKISSTDHPDIMDIAETDVLPAFFMFKDKKMSGKFIGFKGLAKLQAMVDEALAK